MNKVALFDFCETLTDFQTADAFVDFVRQQSGSKRMQRMESLQEVLIKTKVIRVLSVLFPGRSINKRIKLFQLKGFTKEQLENYAKHYYIERIKPHFIKPVNEKLRSLQKDGYKVGLVSGGYGIYLRYFVEEFNLDFCISSNVEICNGSCTGRLDGLDCLNQNKICLLEKYFPSAPIESIAFSDSRSDLPLLLWVKRGVVISRDKHQNWIDNYKLEEIIWKKQNS